MRWDIFPLLNFEFFKFYRCLSFKSTLEIVGSYLFKRSKCMSLQSLQLFTLDRHVSFFSSSNELNGSDLPFHSSVYIYSQRMGFPLLSLSPFSSYFYVVSRFQLPWRRLSFVRDYLVRRLFASGIFFVPLFSCHFHKIFEVFGIRI